jgi:cytochrome c-type biogenesis protein CcmH/NrfG
MQGKLDEAIVEFQRALQIDPENQNSRVGLERALELKQRQARGTSQEAPR